MYELLFAPRQRIDSLSRADLGAASRITALRRRMNPAEVSA
jgi:hypothetical protein